MLRIALSSVAILIGLLLDLTSHRSLAASPCSTGKTPFQVITRDANATLVPGISFVVYHQKTNPDGNPYFDAQSLATGKTDPGGQSPIVCLKSSDAPFAVKLYAHSASVGFFTVWNADLKVQRDVTVAELAMSSLEVSGRSSTKALVPKIQVEVFPQVVNADGKLIMDPATLTSNNRILSTTTGEIGRLTAYLGPGSYVVRLEAPDNRQPVILWDQRLEAGKATVVDYAFPTLRFVLQDGSRAPMPNQVFTLLNQASVDGLPTAGSTIGKFQTDNSGQRDLLLTPGAYVIQVPTSVPSAPVSVWNLVVKKETITRTVKRLSSLRVAILDSQGNPRPAASFTVARQVIGRDGQPHAGTVIIQSAKTGVTGSTELFLPPDTYTLTVGKQLVPNVTVSKDQETRVRWPNTLTLQPADDVRLETPLANATLAFTSRSLPRLNVFPRFRTRLSGAFRVAANRLPKAYTVRFAFSSNQLKAAGIDPRKLSIIFFSDKQHRWRYVGRVNTGAQVVSASLRETGTVLLVAKR